MRIAQQLHICKELKLRKVSTKVGVITKVSVTQKFVSQQCSRCVIITQSFVLKNKQTNKQTKQNKNKTKNKNKKKKKTCMKSISCNLHTLKQREGLKWDNSARLQYFFFSFLPRN